MSLRLVVNNTTNVRPEPRTDADERLCALYDEFQDACNELTGLDAHPAAPLGTPDNRFAARERNTAVDVMGKIIEAAAPLAAWETHGMHAKAVLARHAAELLFESGAGSAPVETEAGLEAALTPEAALILSFIADVERQASVQLTGATE